MTTLHFAPALWLSPFFWHHSRYLIWKPLACSLKLDIGTILKHGSSHRAGAKWRVVTWFVIYIPWIQYQDCKQSLACMDVSPRLFRQGFATFEKISELFWLELEIFFQSPPRQPHSQDVHLKGLVPTREVLVDLEFDRGSSDNRRSCHRRSTWRNAEPGMNCCGFVTMVGPGMRRSAGAFSASSSASCPAHVLCLWSARIKCGF